MFGWEFPPYKSGGLGTACFDLTRGLSNQGAEVTFVMPNAPDEAKAEFVRLISANKLTKNIKIKKINSILSPYLTSEGYTTIISSSGTKKSQGIYGTNLHEEVCRYSFAAIPLAKKKNFDIIHVHDWMTYQAGINAKKISKKPLIAHIHATEFDRTGGNPDPTISSIEYTGLKNADIIIANSNFTKKNVIKHYNLPPEKIKVVHWGIDPSNPDYNLQTISPFEQREKTVLFLGRITIQKGPDYFVEMANKVLKFIPNTRFIIAGSGDMFENMVNTAAELGILDRFLFTGFLKGADVHRAFQIADLYVMPSVSEPFGLVALESLKNNTPILISNQSGASEVINHALKADFWDTDEMANKVVNALKYPELLEELKENSFKEAQKFNLITPAKEINKIYEQCLTPQLRTKK